MFNGIHLTWVDYLILSIYFVFVIGIGAWLKRAMTGSTEFFTSGRSIPAWVTGLAFLSANLGAQEVIGMAASGAKYGIMTSHFYWVGAIPAMVFLAIFMMPFYYGSKARSVPEYLKLRFDEKTRGLNAILFAGMTIFSSGISLHALAKLMVTLNIGLSYWPCIFVSAFIVLVYIFLGGLTSAIYNEVLQFFMIVLGFAPLVYLGLRNVGGWEALKAKLIPVATGHTPPFAPGTWTHSWTHMGSPADNPMGADVFSMVVGLGFVLSFGYWCTDFLVVQRAMAAKTMNAARRTPLIAAFPKMLFPALVILPGMIAIALHTQSGGHFLPLKDGKPDYDLTIPTLLGTYFPTGILGVGFTALMASFMSGMAGNVTAFNTVWTYDLYQSYIAPDRSDEHYLWMGKMATVVGILLSILTAFFASKFDNIMDALQMVFSFVNAPLLATFLLGMFWKRTTGHGAFWGLACGLVGVLIVQGLSISAGNEPGIKGGWISPSIHFASEMSENFRLAIVAWVTCTVVTVAVSLATPKVKTDEELKGLVYSLTPKPPSENEPWYEQPVTLGIIVLVCTVILNFVFA